jgi:hypothetical protein
MFKHLGAKVGSKYRDRRGLSGKETITKEVGLQRDVHKKCSLVIKAT